MAFAVELGVGAMNLDQFDDNMNTKFSQDEQREEIDVVGMDNLPA
jgi:hypothetical protein